jgi:DNA mismatch repair protein MutL
MTSKIRVLSEQTINQIAAGEVIENPSSVVKELVENSIDAGATDICVEITGGGRQLIRITDNGWGMNADDAVLCLERHATSKIRETDDIHQVLSMGFRGEAIPSIASISKFMIITCPQGADVGTMVIVDGGRLVQCSPAARSPGTTIEVKQLFFNVPVRKKFQRSPAYDQNEILKMLTLIALGHPNIKFQLIGNHTTLLNTTQSDFSGRVADVLGPEFVASCTSIDVQQADFHLKGLIGLPGFTRHNRTGQYLFINQRAIQSPLISYAVRDGYGTALPTTRHPIYVLHLTLPSQLVDVNVHPQKKEVRLRHEQELKEFVIRSIEKNLTIEIENETAPVPSFTFEHIPFASEEAVVTNKPVFTYNFPKQAYLSPAPIVAETPVLFEAQPVKPAIKILATIPNYILIEKANGFGVIDQRAAHARILFEKMSQDTPSATQMLLIPHMLQTTPVETNLLKQNLEFIEKMGIKIHESGPNVFLIEAVPQFLSEANLNDLFSDLLSGFVDGKWVEKERLKQVASSASRSALSANKRLTIMEAQSLVNQLFDCEQSAFCPKGKPTMVHLDQEDLSKLFQRVL